MKPILFFIIIIFSTLTIGCDRQGVYSQQTLNLAEQLAATNPDSAYTLISELDQDTLSDENFARWCMLYGKLSYRISLEPLPVFDWQNATAWYEKHGTLKDRLRAKLFLGEAYANDQQSDSAIKTYTDAFLLAEQNKDYNAMGYACSHIGSLYESQFYDSLSTEKFQQAGIYFQKAGNTRSYACALRDLARQYVYSDSLDLAFKIIRKADSIASTLHDNEVYSSILNAYGNLYLLTDDFSQAEKYFLQSLELSKDTLPDYLSLISTYIETGLYPKAKEMLQKVYPQHEQTSYTLNSQFYQIAKEEHNYEQALMYLEKSTDIYDSIVSANNGLHIATWENRYNTLRLKNENAELRLKYLFTGTVLFTLFICSVFLFYRQRQKSKKQLIRQQTELNRLKVLTQALSHEIEEKKALLEESKKKNIQQAERLQIEINLLNEKHLQLKRDFLTHSDIYKKLSKLIHQRPSTDGKPMLTKALWKQLTQEVTEVYPDFNSYVLERYPNISESEWNYCCFCLLGFDGNDAAKLLGITPNSIYTKTFRLRQKLNITLPPQTSLSDYLISQLN